MKTLIILFSQFCVFTNVIGQNNSKQNAVYIQLLGNGLLSSVNYERQVLKKPVLSINAGIGIYGLSPTNITIPIGQNI